MCVCVCVRACVRVCVCVKHHTNGVRIAISERSAVVRTDESQLQFFKNSFEKLLDSLCLSS